MSLPLEATLTDSHPDKIRLGANETMEMAEAKFVDITKAYKALTDEATRENLQKYGNPDGPQQREDKIAIPKWVVEGNSQAIVLLAYGLVLGFGIPWLVGRWWFRQRSLTRDGVLNGTAELFFHQLREDTDFLSLVTILSSALEYVPILGKKVKGGKKARKERQAKIEELEKVLDEKRKELGIEEDPTMSRDSRATVTTAVGRRARALLWAQLFRLKLDRELEEEQLEVLRATPPLIHALSNIALAHNWLNCSLMCLRLQAALAQGVPIGVSPLAQFPGISLEQAQDMSITTGAEGDRWLEKWLAADVKGLDEARKVAKTWPRLEIKDVEFRVEDEKIVPPSSIVALNYKARFAYPVPATKSNGKAIANDEKPVVSKTSKSSKPVTAGYLHAPRWPGNRVPRYHVLLGDSKLNKVIVQPVRNSDIPLPNPDGTPGEFKEFQLQFQAPPQANLYSFVAHFVNDSLVGADIQKPVMLRVQDPPEVSDDSDDDISEPEEDSLAGQMAMMRGEMVKPSAVHGYDDDESEYETDTDTSSDEEGPAKPRSRGGRPINVDTSDEE